MRNIIPRVKRRKKVVHGYPTTTQLVIINNPSCE